MIKITKFLVELLPSRPHLLEHRLMCAANLNPKANPATHQKADLTASPAAAGPFIGDGEFEGDGSAALQKLWDMLPWQHMRVHCPGRYRLAGRQISVIRAQETAPLQLLATMGVQEEKGSSCGAEMMFRSLVINAESLGREDSVFVARFSGEGGGGLLTYVKPSGVFVHTLNTDSNLKRKLDAMGQAEAVEFLWKGYAENI